MTSCRKFAAVLLAALAGAAAIAFSLRAQPQQQPTYTPSAASTVNPNLVVLDPAHGGPDSGAALADNAAEKDVTLAFAGRLQAALAQAGFTVVSTRSGDLSDPLTTDQRAEIANRAHALACIVLHATQTGAGVHIYTSTLQPAVDSSESDSGAFVPTPWDSAQATYVSASADLQSAITGQLAGSHLPALTGTAPLRPLNNLMCPAVAVEIAPLLAPGVGATPVTDAAYQQQIAASLAAALRQWRSQSTQPAAGADDADSARAIAAAEAAARAAARARAAAAAQSAPPRGTP